MGAAVSIEIVTPRLLAAVRRQLVVAQIPKLWRPALDQVWAFLHQHPGMRAGGHNVFLYHHPPSRDLPMEVHFGVEVTDSFPPSGEVLPIATPEGRVAAAVHVGPYDRLGETHQAIHAWAGAHDMRFAGKSWEIYGDWTADSMKLETRVEYLLA